MARNRESRSPVDPTIWAEVQRRTDQDLITRALIGIGVYPVLLVLLATMMPFRREHGTFFWVASAVIALSVCVRLYLLWCSRHARLPLREYWFRLLLSTVLGVAGTMGGLSVAVLHWYGVGTWIFSLVMLWLIGTACGSTITFTPNRYMMQLNIGLLLGPSTLYAFRLHSEQTVTLAVGAQVLMGYLVLQGRRLHRMYWDLLSEQAVRQHQTQELQAARLAAESAREAMRFQATHDSLTGLWNRAEIVEFLEREVRRAARSRTPLGVLMLDTDRFKRINDQYGHLAGDGVLKAVAERLPANLRACDGVGRYGGEEFLLVLPGCDLHQLKIAGERIRGDIAAGSVTALAEQPNVTVSIGCAVGNADEHSAEDLLRAADEALYEAKRRGRNCVATVALGQLSPAGPSTELLDVSTPSLSADR